MKHEARWVIAILTIVSIGCLAGLAYVIWGQSDRPSVGATNFEECVGAGNPVMESHPRQCNDVRTGKTFVEQLDEEVQDDVPELKTREYQSAKGVTVFINNWAYNREVTSPLTITGQVPGSWSHEGVFTIDLSFEGDVGLPGATARLQGDWMTDELVPFTATLEFDSKQLVGKDVAIIIRNANPSGLPENDDSLSLEVQVVE